MKVIDGIPDKRLIIHPVVTIGNFDGVHIGHQKILTVMSELAREKSGQSLVFTFTSHPRRVINPDVALKHIATLDEKIDAMSRCNIDYMMLLDFSQDIASLNALEFFNHYFIEMAGAREIVIGYDHAFGKNREGNMDFLTKLSLTTGIGITRIEEVLLNQKPVSSTWLRNEITAGNMKIASMLLGKRYGIRGKVVRGYGRGRGIGFPTANIVPLDPEKLVPGDGVYAVSVFTGGDEKEGMANIGFNPTYGNRDRTIEANIFDFNSDIYEEEIVIEFHEKIRDEKKFESPEALIIQIRKDMDDIKKFFKDHS